MCVLYVVHLSVKNEDYLNSHLPNYKLETVSHKDTGRLMTQNLWL